ncbi:MAG: aspartyl/asparaginyl beta-hydroxylase domain-containing protein, partial [Caulobacterales bacterium]|nr:aspartyl/asparaginyl beta-hydroxylase domain-containing protein [Caulobacterales bacterium]
EAEPDRPVDDPHGMLGNADWSSYFLWRDGRVVEEAAARCPQTMEALKEAPLARVSGRTPSVLFSLLRPGAHIPAHRGMVNTRLICHLPLIAPAGCRFRVGNDMREWEEGRAWIFDDSIEHEAWNDSAETRVILLFDIWRPELTLDERRLVQTLFEAVDSY